MLAYLLHSRNEVLEVLSVTFGVKGLEHLPLHCGEERVSGFTVVGNKTDKQHAWNLVR